MRVFVVPVVVVAGILAAVSAADPVAQVPPARPPAPLPPPPGGGGVGQLRSDLAALAKEREEAAKETGTTAVAADRAVLRAQLADLLKRINERPLPAAPTPKQPSPRPSKWDPPERPLDTIRMAENLFRDGDVDAALRAFRLVEQTPLPREDRAFVQYMTACCLRKMNKRSEAAVIYREVADAKEDEFIAECAIWQLSLIRSTQELEAQLEQLHSRPKSR
jgi:Fe-S oxidoreductase